MSTNRLVPFTDVTGQHALPDGVKRLVVSNRVGQVTVLPDGAGEVRVEAGVRLDSDRVATTAKGNFADHVLITVDGETLTVVDAHTGQPDHDDWALELTVHAPPGLGLNVKNGVGDMRVSGSWGAVFLETGVGDARFTGAAAGELSAVTGVGDIHLTVESVAGTVSGKSGTGGVRLTVATAPTQDVKLTTGVGDVSLKLPAGAPGSFALDTGVGSVHVPGLAGIAVSKSGPTAKAAGTVGTGGPNYTLSTGVGAIHIE